MGELRRMGMASFVRAIPGLAERVGDVSEDSTERPGEEETELPVNVTEAQLD